MFGSSIGAFYTRYNVFITNIIGENVTVEIQHYYYIGSLYPVSMSVARYDISSALKHTSPIGAQLEY